MNSDIFREAVEKLNISQVADHLSLTVRRGFINCPFHKERTASCKLYDRSFHCFGCNAHGDAISLAAQVWGCGQFEALQRLNREFSLGLDVSSRQAVLHKKRERVRPSMEQIWHKDALDLIAETCRQYWKLGFHDELMSVEQLHQQLLEATPETAHIMYGREVWKYATRKQRLEKLRALVGRAGWGTDEILAIMGRT